MNQRITLINIVSGGTNDDEADACLRALFLTDTSADRATLITTKGPRVDGTCQWIKSHALYDSWLDSQSQLLWLSGGPGKGKTMLSIFLATELEKMARHPQNKLFLQYFCDNKDKKRNTAVAVLRGLISQLLQSHPKLFRHILPTFRIQKESLVSFETLWRIFENMVCDPGLGTTYCVLDGLDECDEASLEVLLRKFAALLPAEPIESSACHLNLLVVSRDLPDFIPYFLSRFPQISLDSGAHTEIDNDIALFIEATIKELSEDKNYSEALRVHVKNVFRDRAEGRFLWIGIAAQELKECKASEVEETIALFPKGLDEMYARILLQIKSHRREIAAKILRWVVMAFRPLTFSELSIAIGTTASPALTRDEMIRDQVLYCGNILVIKEDEVALIHQSAKDYLLRTTCDTNPALEFFRVKEEAANLEIARKCLDYLQSGALENRECEPGQLLRNPGHLRTFPLLSYAVLHWHEHARSVARSEDIFDLSRPFYHKTSPIRTSWLKAYWDSEFCERPPNSFTLLMLASYFGILPLAEKLVLKEGLINRWMRSYNLNETDGQGMTALIWAAAGGYEAIVQLLLENGADIRTKARWGQAVIAAAEGGHEAIIRLLLNKGTDTKTMDRYKAMALFEAADSGYEAVVRLLLEDGVDIETKTDQRATVLIVAAGSGHEAIVQLLLEKGADFEATDCYRETALMRAAGSGHEAFVQMLLEKGAKIEAKDCHGQTALMRAADHGQEALVRLLLEKGANINAKDVNGKRALTFAVVYVHEALVQLLLNKGADFESIDWHGQTALMKAAGYGQEAFIRLLLKEGANINAKNGNGDTALIFAAMYGHEAAVQLLLEKGADTKIKSKNKQTALMRAVEKEEDCLPWEASRYNAVIRLLTPKPNF